MKTLIAAILLVCSSAFAQQLDATRDFLSLIPEGEYIGKDRDKVCKVVVKKLSNKVVLTISMDGETKSSEFTSNVKYFFSQDALNFETITTTKTRFGTNENRIATVALEESPYDRLQYVVIADLLQEGSKLEASEVGCPFKMKR